ncbi:hypothetical protein J7M28_04375 [bacterium]|nr:hypothetical protein [bacterium]
MYFRVVVECGHIGAGKSFEAVRYWRARNVSAALSSASSLPRAKKKSVRAVKSVVPISRTEYVSGLRDESQDPYLTYNLGSLAVKEGASLN